MVSSVTLKRSALLSAAIIAFSLFGYAGVGNEPVDSGYDIPAANLRIRDPYVFADKESGKYYMHANGFKLSDAEISKFGVGRKALYAYESKDLKNWKLLGPSFIAPSDFWGKSDFWAPDMFYIDGKYYIIATFSAEKPSIKTMRGKLEPMRGCAVLVSDRPDKGFKPLSDKPITPENWMALDGTLFEDGDGSLWLLYCREWLQVGDGEIVAQKISRDLKKTLGEPKVLFKASSAPWIADKSGTHVTDAPVVNRLPDGTLYMTWSSFSGKYRIGAAKSPSGKIDGEWVHFPYTLNNDDGGHAMVFKTFSGGTKISYHSPNSKNETLTIRDFGFKDGNFFIGDK